MKNTYLYITLICLLLSPAVTHGQGSGNISVRDSLLQIAEGESGDLKTEAYLALSEFYLYSRPDSCIYFADKVITADEQIKTATFATALSYKATALFYKGEYQESIRVADTGIASLYGEDDQWKLRADLTRIAGVATGAIGNYEISLERFLTALNIYESNNDTTSANATLNNIGVTRLKLDHFDEALEIFLRLDSLEEKDPGVEVAIPINLAFIYFELGELQKAKEQVERGLSVINDVDTRASGLYYLIGEIYLKESNLNKAEQSFLEALDKYKAQNNVLEQVPSLIGLANTRLARNDISQAWDYAEQALEIADRYDALPEKRSAIEMLYNISKDRDQFSQALRYHEQLKVISDSLQNAAVNAEIGRLSAAYEFEQREQELLLKQKLSEVEANNRIKRRNILILIIFSVLLFSLVVLFFLNKNFVKRKQLNEMLTEKNNEIREKAAKLEHSNQVKNQLFSIIAHDLRGPLSSLQGIVSLLERDALTISELEELLPLVGQQVDNTSTLLRNLLEWSQSQMEAYIIQPEKFNLTDSIRSKKDLFSVQLEQKKLKLIYPEEEFFVYADPDMIELVIQNLISNAIKFSDPGGTITVQRNEQDGEARITVSDTGVGISQDKIPDIFSNSFYSTPGTQGEKGSGLGMMLCKEFVEKNEGRIWVESTPGEGSSFIFTLPFGSEN